RACDGVVARGGLYEPEHVRRKRPAGAPRGLLRNDPGPADLRRAGVARSRYRADGRRSLAVQLATALPARRHPLLELPLRVLARPLLYPVLSAGHAVRARPEPGAAAVSVDRDGGDLDAGVPVPALPPLRPLPTRCRPP